MQPQAWVSPDRVTEPALPYLRGQSEARPRRRLVLAAQQMLATAAAVTAAALIGVVGSSETFAPWSGSGTVEGASITSGDVALVLGGGLPAFANALPGEEQHFAFSIENAGDVDLAVTTSIETTFPHFEIRSLIIGASEDCESYDLSYLPALTTIPDPTASLIYAGEQLQVCAVVTALPGVVPEESVEFTLLLEGVQTP